MATVVNVYGQDGVSFTGVSATIGPYTVLGGLYAVGVASGSWNSASIELDIIMPDGSTLVAAVAAFNANGNSTVYLPPGQIQFTVTGTPTDPIMGYLALVPLRPQS